MKTRKPEWEVKKRARNFKRIGGKLFSFHSQSLGKKRAEEKAESLRNWFKNVRVFERAKGHYDVYVHQAKKYIGRKYKY